MFFRLLACFVVIPLVELYLLLRLADATSGLTTFAIVIVTGLIGTTLAKREGMGALRRFQAAVAQGRVPGKEIRDGLMIVFAGALLLTPGLITDAIGFLLLIPATRDAAGAYLARRYASRFQWHVAAGPARPERASTARRDANTIDAPQWNTIDPSDRR